MKKTTKKAARAKSKAEDFEHSSLRPVKDTTDIWEWLSDHPAFATKGRISLFEFCLTIMPVMTMKNGTASKDSRKNTVLRYWLECGPAPQEWPGTLIHDYKLDCGGATFEKALRALYRNVRKEYGDYRMCAKCYGLGTTANFTFPIDKKSGLTQLKSSKPKLCAPCRGSGYTKGVYPRRALGVGGADGMRGPVPFNRALLL